jgi:glycosyltransferase involved in cell wall biosynthesis
MLEAMATGCLIVASDTAPVRELITSKENGLLVDFFNPEEIADTVEAVLDNPSAYQLLREAARDKIVQHYHLPTLLAEHLQWLLD